MYTRREGEAARETLIHNVCTCMSTPLVESVILSIVSYYIGTMSQTVNSNCIHTIRQIKNDFISHVEILQSHHCQYLYKEVKDISILYQLLVSNNEELSIAKELAINMAR